MVAMHERAARLGVVLSMHSTRDGLEVHMAVDESGQHGQALGIESPSILRWCVAEGHDDAVSDAYRRVPCRDTGSVDKPGIDDR